MGASSSSLIELHKNEHLLKLSGKQAIPLNDTFWNQLLSFSFKPPRTCGECRVLEDSVQGILSSLLTNNSHTGNYCTLIKVFLGRAADLKSSAAASPSPALNSLHTWQTYNALLIIRFITKYFIQTVTEDEVVKQFQAVYPEAGCCPEPQNGNLSLLERLLTTLIEIIVDVPFTELTYGIALEAVNCLLVLLSVQMYSSRPASKSMVYRTLLHGKCTIHAPLLIKTLLQHYMAQEKWKMMDNAGGGSIILGLASGLWHVLTLGYGGGGGTDRAALAPADDTPLANQSLLLTLVLTNHCTNDKLQPNPYRQALISFTHQAWCGTEEEVMEASCPMFRLDLAQLYHVLCSTLSCDQTTLLLYLLLHRNPSFRNFALSMAPTDDRLIVPLLKILYNAPESSSHHVYMALIILLILSEDDYFNTAIHDIMLKNVTWYTERAISEISLGGLLVLVVIRTIQYNISRMRDKYLHTNCLAALANMSNHFKNLHPYVCQKFIGLFEHLAKRLVRVELQIRAPPAPTQQPESVAVDLTSELVGLIAVDSAYWRCVWCQVQDAGILEEVVRMVLEILNSVLSSRLVENPDLVYTLLYKKQAFELVRDHPACSDLLANLNTVLAHFSEKLEQVEKPLSVAEVSAIIQQTALHWPQDKLKIHVVVQKFPELKFKYMEEDQPEEFFIPYIWSLIYSSSSGISWSFQNIVLFAPPPSPSIHC
ncbi:DYM [Cordylochernes scorpioides]|uniref:Dymeclin n=1 Tax=Cordylochernes scorpioides TaxID=51811 RepID=A0ABY6KLU5_9ARAC|nr:DYM [Cordylochernes scorpioides]